MLRFLLKKYAQYTLFLFSKKCVCVSFDEIVAFDFIFFAKRTHRHTFCPQIFIYIYSVCFFLIWKKCVLCVWCILFRILLRLFCVLVRLVMKQQRLFLLTWLTWLSWLTWLVLGGALPPKPPIGLLPKPACGAQPPKPPSNSINTGGIKIP